MKLGVFLAALGGLSFEDACNFVSSHGADAVEIGCGGFPGKAHCDAREFIKDDGKIRQMQETLAKYQLSVSGLSCHGNMVHPNPQEAERFEKDFDAAIILAEKMGVDVVNTFSGCPGGSPYDRTPNWVTCPWPEDFTEILNYQWEKVLIPFWKEKIKFVREHGIHKIALEMHPGFCVYSADTLLRLREEVGEEIGANFDPSHLIWQGAEPVQAIRALGEQHAIYHFHAKDTRIDPLISGRKGVLDNVPYSDDLHRSWIFRTVGYGHGASYWKDIVSELRRVGYDGTLSIEHEDSLMSGKEGLSKAIEFLKPLLIREYRGTMFWA